MNRRQFVIGLGGALAVGGCRSLGLVGGSPRLKFGVVSDIHVTTPESTALFEKSLRYFRSRGADAVMVPGDLTDWGILSGYRYVRQAWDRVFAGTDVVPLFVTGNHDFDGWWYPDMTMEMHANGYSEDDANTRHGQAAAWRAAFGEEFADIRLRTVKGYDFVSCEWGRSEALADWMKARVGRFGDGRPFFFFQHAPLADTVQYGKDEAAFAAMKDYPNAVVFTGHTHQPFNDERSIWQGAFTAVAVPSLSYASVPHGYENGGDNRYGKSVRTMACEPYRRNIRGGQGFFVTVFDDRLEIERIDLDEDFEQDLPVWTPSLPARGTASDYAPEVRQRQAQPPRFPAGAALKTFTRNADDRQGHWAIAMTCEFPSAIPEAETRVFDYEIRVVPRGGKGTEPRTLRFLSPAFARLARHEPPVQRFWFNVDLLPQDENYVIEVRARNCWGACSAPLVSSVRHGVPGLAKSKESPMADYRL